MAQAQRRHDSTTPPPDDATLTSTSLFHGGGGSSIDAATAPSEHAQAREHWRDYADDPHLSPLEAQVLAEYRRLHANLERLGALLGSLASYSPPAPSGVASAPGVSAGGAAGGAGAGAVAKERIADGLRVLERRAATVYTALKSSVYGIVLAQMMGEQAGGAGEGGGEGDGGGSAPGGRGAGAGAGTGTG